MIQQSPPKDAHLWFEHILHRLYLTTKEGHWARSSYEDHQTVFFPRMIKEIHRLGTMNEGLSSAILLFIDLAFDYLGSSHFHAGADTPAFFREWTRDAVEDIRNALENLLEYYNRAGAPRTDIAPFCRQLYLEFTPGSGEE
ncbi:hypothetical protein N0V90_008425 [Kalmusia sp. IMI 367209]|nr:hypothetical protein N0V90_008425 [Kalmusia sp. IMI 367209]